MSSSERRVSECERDGCPKGIFQVYYCVDCDTRLCELCWPLYQPHTNNKKGRDGLEHEKTQHQIFTKLKDILEPDYNDKELEELLDDDLHTTWFGVRRGNNGQPLFVNYDTFSAVTSGPSSTLDRAKRYPQLASFVGQTNAGKSTLIKMLIRRGKEKQLKASLPYPTPIAGSKLHAHTPTSADVHLYVDPELHHDRTPLLYADCEGFEGGEKPPLGAFEHRISATNDDIRYDRLSPGRTRPLDWANADEKRSRSYAVKHLYPRILYTFSDVVVFVLRDSKTFEATALRLLLEWGKASLETSVNQPTLPHAVIALNNTEIGVSVDEWDVRKATESLLRANEACLDRLNGQRDFIKIADDWRNRGRKIDNILDLIRCYYSTFTVIRIPTKGRYQLLEEQIWKLHEVVANACDASFKSKMKARMLLHADELDVYLQSAYTHFALPKGLTDPFNFMKVSLKHNPIPTDFKGHILQLALSIKAQFPSMRSEKIFHLLGDVVAACIMLDFTRHRKGRPQDMLVEYQDSCSEALEEFCDLYTPCEYKHGSEVCVNVASAHLPKGHQNARGKWIGDGRFKSKIQPERFWPTWQDEIGKSLAGFDNELQRVASDNAQTVSPEELLNELHSKRMTRLYDRLGSADKFISHTTCLCCLMQAPLHTLPCGHTLCTRCVRSYGVAVHGSTKNTSVLDMEFCPLHLELEHWPSPYYVRFKPEHAGVRLLSLDGGGMRGIVELEVLRAVQKQLGDQIPLQAFFDLILGTSTGGIIALGFGVKGWSVEQCTEKFLEMCNQAFSKRKLQSISFLKHFVTLRHASKYETTPLRETLKASFGDQPLFGSDGKATTAPVPKVAVSATDGSGKKAIVIANYNRRDDARKRQRKLHYVFPRPTDPDLELQIWEAAAATSAAPSYFKPFIHELTEKTYLDGALYHNNPVRLVRSEAELLWPDVADAHPDILLSIGTGQERRGNMSRDPLYGFETARRKHRRETSDSTASTKRSGFTFMGFRQILNAMHSRFDNILHAENAWLDFCELATKNDDAFRYVRINPEIKDLPSLDDVAQLKAVQAATRNSLERPESRAQIKKVAHMLVASSFYYERTNVPRNVYNGYSCTGKICCRFEDDSDELRAFGDYLRNQQTKDSRLAFEIENVTEQRIITRVELSADAIWDMSNIASFSLPTPAIHVRDKNDKIKISLLLPGRSSIPERHVISGFPRVIMTEDRVLEPTPELSAKKGRVSRKTPRAFSGGTPRTFELGSSKSRPQTSRRNVSDPEVRSTPSELATSEHELRSGLSGRPAMSTRREHTTGNLQTFSSSPTSSIVSKMVHEVPPKVHEGFGKSFKIGPVQITEPVELPLTVSASTGSSVRGLPTSRVGYERQRAAEVPVPNFDLSRTSGSAGAERERENLSPEVHDRFTRKRGGGSSSAAYSGTFEVLVSACKDPEPATSQDMDKHQAQRNNSSRLGTALNPLLEESDAAIQHKADAKRPEREHCKPPLSFAAKQRLPQSTSKSSLPSLRPPKSSLQHMSSASTISSVASDISEMSVADSINLDAYTRRAEERERRERLRLMASNSTLAFSDVE